MTKFKTSGEQKAQILEEKQTQGNARLIVYLHLATCMLADNSKK